MASELTHLLDSDVTIEILRQHDPHVRKMLAAQPNVAISAVTVAELSYGVHRDPAGSAAAPSVDALLALASILPLDEAAARESGAIRAELAAKGTPIGPYDLLIAGIARSRGLTLATRNLREFKRVRGLVVERW